MRRFDPSGSFIAVSPSMNSTWVEYVPLDEYANLFLTFIQDLLSPSLDRVNNNHGSISTQSGLSLKRDERSYLHLECQSYGSEF